MGQGGVAREGEVARGSADGPERRIRSGDDGPGSICGLQRAPWLWRKWPSKTIGERE